MDLNTTWFILLGVLFTGYAILDGFDLGVGALHLLIKGDKERRIALNSIGPIWDGNEVWLITAGGALFAAFPHAYATAFSTFYTAFMVLLFVIIFRALSIDFRSKLESQRWRNNWDRAFSISSILISFLAGTALGNIIIGIPIDAAKESYIGFFDLLRPYPILVGITTTALFTMHGAIYLVLKTEGDLQEKVRGWVNPSIIFFVITYISTTAYTLIYVPHMLDNMKEYPALFSVAIINMLAVANIPREIHHKHEFRAFLFSGLSILFLFLLFGIGMFPDLIYSFPNPENSLTIYTAASSQQTLQTMLFMALIGMPLVLTYTTTIFWIFRGKVKLDETSY